MRGGWDTQRSRVACGTPPFAPSLLPRSIRKRRCSSLAAALRVSQGGSNRDYPGGPGAGLFLIELAPHVPGHGPHTCRLNPMSSSVAKHQASGCWGCDDSPRGPGVIGSERKQGPKTSVDANSYCVSVYSPSSSMTCVARCRFREHGQTISPRPTFFCPPPQQVRPCNI